MFHPEKEIVGHTASGKPITEEMIEELAKEAEVGYDVEAILHQRQEQEVNDLVQLADAFRRIYLMALNGVVCSPADKDICLSCARAWAQGKEVLDKVDPNWGF